MKKMKQYLRWPVWVVLAALLVAGLIPALNALHMKPVAAHASDATNSLTFSLSASVVYPNETVQATGTGFAPGDVLSIVINGYYLDTSILCDQSGNCSGVISMPQFVQGVYAVVATGSSGLSAQTSVSYVPHITATPTRGGPGTTVQLQGSGFAANETVQAYWNGSKGILEGTGYTDYYGNLYLSFSFTVPTGVAPGSYPITIVRSNQTPAKVNTRFIVQPPSLTSTGGIRDGQAVHVRLSGFQASEQVALTWNANGGQSISMLTMNNTGAEDTYVVPPSAPKGAYILTAKGVTSGLQAISNLNIGPGIALNLNTSNPGGTITVNGGGFTTGETVNVYFQNQKNGVVSAVVDASGSFSVPLGIPIQHSSKITYYVYAVSTTGPDHARAEFYYMTPALQVDSDIYFKSQFVIMGQGFAARETVTLFWEFSGQKYPLKLGATQAANDGTFSFTAIAASAPYIQAWPFNGAIATIAAKGSDKTTASLLIYESGTLIVNKNSGSIGSKVRVVGGAFGSAESVIITLQNVQVATVTTGINGAFAVDFTIPTGLSVGGGYFGLDARGVSSGVNLSAFFYVYLPLHINPDTGPSGTAITVRGWDYEPSSQVNLYWCDPTQGCYLFGNPLTTVTTTQAGTFKTTVIAPANLISGHTYEIVAGYPGESEEVAYAKFVAQ